MPFSPPKTLAEARHMQAVAQLWLMTKGHNDAVHPDPTANGIDITRPYGACSITGPAEDVAYILRHLPDVDDSVEKWEGMR